MVQTQSRDDLVREHLPLARRLATRYRHTSEALEDLTQVAYVGLVLAADRFDPERGVSFKSYAIPTIVGELRRHIRDHAWAARVPRSLQENVLRVSAASSELNTRLARSPTIGELAKETGLEPEAVVEALGASSAYEAESLDTRTTSDGDEREPLVARLGSEDSGYTLVEYGVSMQPALAELSAQESAIVAMRFFEDLTQAEIARRIGISQMQVSRVLRRAVDQLHHATQAAA
ncbi:MAG TPA: SigB/SigF/SigG family RNA polymerase sigma factor [Thermoleophilaceae bacterium]|nr:SigB/SigF/SigG family RNA polymerase sigma factor [Thermoleophilaceae bacterium]